MIVSDPNNVKIYNLSAGKSLPEWLSDRKRRALQKKNVGTYKPRVRCYDVNNLSLKFERCFDSDVVTFEILMDDYSKLVFLHCDRYVEFHAAHGRYHRLRIPKFGRDMQYHYPTCDLYLVGAGPEVYRLNLERGQFLNSLVTEASEVNRCAINPVHQLFMCGTEEGKVEAWDPRSRERVGILDCAFSCLADSQLDGFPSVSALKFSGGLTLGVGTATGQVLLYDIRSNKPFYLKDHMYGLPIREVEFFEAQDLVISLDERVVKLWEKNTGKLFTSIEAVDTKFYNFSVIPNTGMIFIANENPKILTYYIPSLGPAPRWCGFLDSLTEELEESNMETVYDDYKFVTRRELQELGLDHLVGTNLLRAYMHGFFMDIRLYKKAKSAAEPFAFEEYRKQKIQQKLDEDRSNRVQLKKLPKVNQDLALKLMNDDMKKKKNKGGSGLLMDERFKALFENPDFQVDKNAEEFRLLNPVLSRLDRTQKKQLKKQVLQQQFDEVEEEPEGRPSSEEESHSDSSSDDDREWTKDLKRQYRQVRQEERERDVEERKKKAGVEEAEGTRSQPKFFALREGEEFRGLNHSIKRKRNNKPLGERVHREGQSSVRTMGSLGNREMTFSIWKEKRNVRAEQQARSHHEERRKLQRSARGLQSKPLPRFLRLKH
ncbi:nucleolar protein 10 isoform X2 [Bacillus rossius redtenbacheri]|uniref:nucleolar protein 10 isoform X2 n=1 Tax=Bacillus rossius redtenbacheri TaxID=93214 RepID=UPI002FDD3830